MRWTPWSALSLLLVAAGLGLAAFFASVGSLGDAGAASLAMIPLLFGIFGLLASLVGKGRA